VHRETTAEEIWSDTNGAVDYLVSGVGTGGTITGVGEVIKQRKNTFRVVAVEPKNSPVISGGKPGPHMIQGIGAGFIPFNLNTKIIDEIIQVEDKDAFDIMKRVNAQEGVGCGVSSGAIIWAAIQLA
jgi:cysteine synthase A